MSDCSLCIGGDYDGLIDCYDESIIRAARKAHKCYECRRTIEIGQSYERVSGRWEGEWTVYRFCLDCREIGLAFSCDGSRVFGSLWEDFGDYGFTEMTTGCLEKLETASAKAYLLERWRKWKGLHA